MMGSVPSKVEQPVRILVFTAQIGGGHEALSRCIDKELQDQGFTVTVVDGLRALSPVLAFFIRRGYLLQLMYAPWTIGPLYRIKTNRFTSPCVRNYYGLLYGWRLIRATRRHRPTIVVSTFPLVTVVLDRLKRTGRLQAPVMTVIADYGAHRLWVGPSTDEHLVASTASADLVRDAGGRARVARMPLPPAFDAPPSKAEARARLGLPADRFITLIVGGAWGVGDIHHAVERALEAGCFPVVVAGNNQDLKLRLEERHPDADRVRIVGWTDQMVALMAASDCLVQNAGGMTCHEAAAVDLPVIFFRPIPGHGRFNAEIMERAGAAEYVRDDAALVRLLADAHEGRAPLARPARRDGIGAAAMIGAVASRPIPAPLRPELRTDGPARLPQWAAAFAVVLALVWAIASPTLAGFGSFLFAQPVTANSLPAKSVALVVRTDDPTMAAELEASILEGHLPVALFVNGRGVEGIHPAKGITIGISQHGREVSITHFWREWRHSSTLSARLRKQMGWTRIYVLPPQGGSSILTRVLQPGAARELHVGGQLSQGRSGIREIVVTGLSIDEAEVVIRREIDRATSEGLRCVQLPSPS